MYLNEFKKAIERSHKFKLLVPRVDFSYKVFLTEKVNNEIPNLLLDKIGKPDPRKVFAQCFGFHYLIQNIFEEYFDVPITYTIGWVSEPPNTLFKQTEEQLFQILKSGPKSMQINLHAWLTLPSMEIIDLTLPTTVAVARGQVDSFGGAISGHPDQFTGGLKYHPMLVGDDFLRKIGVLIDLPIIQFIK